MTIFILVHGTFATHANWPALSSVLTQAARDLGEEPRFAEVLWSGNNTFNARQMASSSVLARIEEVRAQFPGEKIFIIGHSHGGSAVAYFIKAHPELASTLAGFVFLSTPFIAVRPRPHAIKLITALFTVSALIVSTLVAHIFVHGQAMEVFNFQVSRWWWTIVALLPGVVSIVLITATVKAADNVSCAFRNQTADLPSLNYLFIRFSGDEATSALSAVQFLAWAAAKISQIFRWMTRPLDSPRFLIRESFWLGFAFAFVATQVAFADLIPLIQNIGLGQTVRLMVKGLFAGTYAGFFFAISTLLFFVVPLLISILATIAIATLVAQSVSMWAFGLARFAEGLVIELAVEALPFGTHSLVNIDWNFGAVLGFEGIVHSWTYAHPLAIQHIHLWVLKSDENQRSSSSNAASNRTSH